MQDDPIAFFLTWTCYGTWMPGDDRGWTKWHCGDQVPQPRLADWCRGQMVDSAVLLLPEQRTMIESVVREHCEKRCWYLHAVNCRTNHCHVVVTAPNYDGEQVRDQLKSWGKRRMKERECQLGVAEECVRDRWWTRKGSVRYLFDEDSLSAATTYASEAQDVGGSSANSL
ncbi:hypothetical protein RBWH47_02522 [Rhodopirellula baltica WH47]|uniref:Transposase IS200-like domain-containing protein n=2 Tax=Rhodopirellula baltica TaxID=265606 RepID=F2AMP0_RHOBT|nr:hypothetical protein RBWH47_02522 [Rhodopirellula baltica WH47]